MHTRSLAIFLPVFAGAAGLGCFSSNDKGRAPDAGAPLSDATVAADAPVGDGAPEGGGVDGALPDSTPAPQDGGTTSDSANALVEGSGDAAPDAGDAGSGAMIRVANLVPNLGAAVDFCVKPQAGSFGGPYMASQGVTGGLAYGEVSEYASLAAAAGFTVRLVAAGATSCASGLAADGIVGPSAPASPTTVAFTGLAGDAGVPLALRAFGDDPTSTAPASPGTRFRVVHAAPQLPAVDLEIGVTPYTMPIQTGLGYGSAFGASTQATGAPAPDSAGYVTPPGFSTEQVTLVHGGAEITSFFVASSTSSSVSAFLVGVPGSSVTPLGFVSCADLAAPQGHRASCTLNTSPPVTIPARFANLAPDAPAFDVCATLAPVVSYSAPLLAAAGANAGQGYPTISSVVTTIPSGTDFQFGYAPWGTSCATSSFSAVSSSYPAWTELTVVLSETAFPSSASYTSYIFDTGLTADANNAVFGFGNVVKYSGGQTVDLYTTISGGNEQQVGTQGFGPAHSASGLSLTPGSYTLRVADDTSKATLYSKAAVNLAAASRAYWWWHNDTSPATGKLSVCDLAPLAAGTYATCAE